VLFLIFTFKMVDSNVIIWSFCIIWYYQIFIHFVCSFVFVLLLLFLRSCEASLLYCCCYCWFTPNQFKVIIIFFIAFWTTWTTWWFSWLGSVKLQGQVVCMFFLALQFAKSFWCCTQFNSFFPFVIVYNLVLMRVLVREIVYHSFFQIAYCKW
jgi:hypothetical protein